MQDGYYLAYDPRNFDNSFFSISNLEATYMDPAQRQILEVIYETVELAGVNFHNFQGSSTGCFIANGATDYTLIQGRDSEHYHRFSGSGTAISILANRVSHVFNLSGPSFTVDTACSSSMTCVHLACKALEDGDCDAAIVAGANLVLSADQQLGTAAGGTLSADGTCKTFDISADGYGRAEGIGVLYLKRLDKARADRNPVRSIIRSTALNR